MATELNLCFHLSNADDVLTLVSESFYEAPFLLLGHHLDLLQKRYHTESFKWRKEQELIKETDRAKKSHQPRI